MENYSYPNLWRGCVGAWCPSEDRSRSNRLTDFSGYNNHGVLTNMDPATDWVPSQGKIALDFDGVNDFVSCNAPSIGSITQSATVVFCFILNTTGASQSGFSIGVGSTARWQAHFPWSDNNIYFDFGGSMGVNRLTVTGQSWTVGVLEHVVLTTGSSGMQCWRNGALVGSNGNTPTRTNDTNTFEIGRFDTIYFPGSMHEFRVYNRQIIPSEIATLALRRGIAFETERPRRYRVASASTNRRRRLICGSNC